MFSKKNCLISTPLQEKFDVGARNYFLGLYCKSQKNDKQISKLNSITYKHHWLNKYKKQKDYKYLKSTCEKVLEIISDSLNNTHKLRYDKEYWRIIIYPWICQYVTTVFDRWEIIRCFFKKNKKKSFYTYVYNLKESNFVFTDHANFIEVSSVKDDWNHLLFKRIFNSLKIKNLKIIEKKYLKKKSIDTGKTKINFSKLKIFFYVLIDKLIAPVAYNFNKIYFDTFYFPKKEYIKICIQNKLIPTKNINLFNKNYSSKENRLERNFFKNILLNYKTSDKFLQFLVLNLHKDLPKTYLDDFKEIRNKAANLASKKKIILSMHSIFYNDFFKTYIAEAKLRGSKFILSTHGGGFVIDNGRFGWFNYFEKVTDKFITWGKNEQKFLRSKKSLKKMIKLSPTLPIIKKKPILQSDKRIFGKNLTITFTEASRYVYKSGTILFDNNFQFFNELIEFAKKLKKEVRTNIKFRAKTNSDGSDLSYGSNRRFAEVFGEDSVQKMTDISYYNSMLKSKLIVVTHPETIFSEAMYLNIPTILLLNEKHFEFTKHSLRIFKLLKKNKIAFDDFKKAKLHINTNWDNIESWWNKKQIQNARKLYLSHFFNVKADWYEEWQNFIKSINNSKLKN